MYFIQNNATQNAQTLPNSKPMLMQPQIPNRVNQLPDFQSILSEALKKTLQNSTKQLPSKKDSQSNNAITINDNNQIKNPIIQNQNQQLIKDINNSNTTIQQLQQKQQISENPNPQISSFNNLLRVQPQTHIKAQQSIGQTQLVQTPYGTFLQARVAKQPDVRLPNHNFPQTLPLQSSFFNHQYLLPGNIHQQQQQPPTRTITDIINSQIETQMNQKQSPVLQTLRLLHAQNQRQHHQTIQIQQQQQYQQLQFGGISQTPQTIISTTAPQLNLQVNQLINPGNLMIRPPQPSLQQQQINNSNININIESMNILQGLKKNAEQLQNQQNLIQTQSNSYVFNQNQQLPQTTKIIQNSLDKQPADNNKQQQHQDNLDVSKDQQVADKNQATSVKKSSDEKGVNSMWQQALFIQTSLHQRDGARKEEPEDFIRDDPKRLIFQVETGARQKLLASNTNESNHTSATSTKLNE